MPKKKKFWYQCFTKQVILINYHILWIHCIQLLYYTLENSNSKYKQQLYYYVAMVEIKTVLQTM